MNFRRMKLSERARREIAGILAFAILFAAIPVVPQVVASRSDAQLSFTLDVCHPLQSIDRSPETAPLARPDVSNIVSAIEEIQPVSLTVSQFLGNFAPEPESPPPKPSA